MKKAVFASLLVTVGALIGTLFFIIGYDTGYSSALDFRLGASACKPSRYWRPRF